MDGNAKSDLEHTTEKAVRVSAKGGGILTRLFSKLVIWGNKYYQKRFSSSMRALKKDGSSKELSVSPALTKEEAKEIIANARENDILIGVKKMQPDGEVGANKSLHQQEKMAKNEIKYNKWNERSKTFKKVPLLNQLCDSMSKRYKKLSLEDNKHNKEEKYVVICNKSRVGFLTEQLELISKKRVQKKASEELSQVDKETNIEDLEYEKLKTRDINTIPSELDKIGEDYGSCMVKDYNKNYCIQKITKSEYCEIREKLFDLQSHGAIVLNDREMLIAINSEDLEEYKKIAPLDKPIKEFGEAGAREVEKVNNMNNIMNMEIQNEKDFGEFKNKYKGRDFIAEHNPDGTISVIVREEDTKQLVDEVKKKSSTADLLKEANEFAKEKQEVEIPEPEIEIDEDIEIDR